jgi:aminoglycoside 2''-phosphotransferase
LIHNDLGFEHILVDETDRQPVGLIDFESAWIGDPAIDFVPLRAALGSDALDVVLAGRDLGERLRERLWFYRWMGSIHAIIYGVREGNDKEREAGLIELRRRLDDRP